MAQKSHPVSVRLGLGSTWSSLWNTNNSNTSKEFVKYWSMFSQIHSYYQRRCFEVYSYRVEKIGNQNIFFISLRNMKDLSKKDRLVNVLRKHNHFIPWVGRPNLTHRSDYIKSFLKLKKGNRLSSNSISIGKLTNKTKKNMSLKKQNVSKTFFSKKNIFFGKIKRFKSHYFPKFSYSLPRAVRPIKRRSIAVFGEAMSSLEEELLGKSSLIKNGLGCGERRMLLPSLRCISGCDSIIIKSHPSFYKDFTVPAVYLALFVRSQLREAIRRKRKVMPIKYFRKLGAFLKIRLGDGLKGIRFQAKGRLPKVGGSSGAARSQTQLVSMGHLSSQNLISPLDYSYTNLRSRSGICSIKVWVSYKPSLNNMLVNL